MGNVVLFLDGGCVSAIENEFIMNSMCGYLQQEEMITTKITENMDWDRVCRNLEEAQAIVLAADVYLDSVSSEVLKFLEKVEQAVIGGESIGAIFYAVLYTELYEGEQTSVAMEILKNFCSRANITWGRGLGIGGNRLETISVKNSLWRRLRKQIIDFRLGVLQEQALFARERIQGTDVYIHPKEVSRKEYIRKLNRHVKKSNRVKIAQN